MPTRTARTHPHEPRDPHVDRAAHPRPALVGRPAPRPHRWLAATPPAGAVPQEQGRRRGQARASGRQGRRRGGPRARRRGRGRTPQARREERSQTPTTPPASPAVTPTPSATTTPTNSSATPANVPPGA